MKNLINLNEKNDNYNSPIDSIDPITGLKYQTKGSFYDQSRISWHTGFKNEHNKEFYKLIYYCASEDEDIIERIYEFLEKEIKNRLSIEIFNNENEHWYDKYRVMDKEELKKVNKIWKRIK